MKISGSAHVNGTTTRVSCSRRIVKYIYDKVSDTTALHLCRGEFLCILMYFLLLKWLVKNTLILGSNKHFGSELDQKVGEAVDVCVRIKSAMEFELSERLSRLISMLPSLIARRWVGRQTL